MADNMVDAMAKSNPGGVVGGSVIDDQPFHGVESLHGSRKIGQCDSQCFGFIETGDLDDQLHGLPGYMAWSVESSCMARRALRVP
jgi:hypothetical protein